MKFSVIIPVYNVADYLGACLDSVLTAARGYDVEVICVDDGSTDGSAGVLAQYAARDSRVKVISQANAGVSAARNRALEAASGDWLLFVDSDDSVRETWLDAVVEAVARQPDVDLVGTGMVLQTGVTPDWGERSCAWRDVGLAQTVDDCLEGMSVYRFAYRRDRMGDLRFPSLRYGEDLQYVAEAFVRSRRCLVRDRAEYAYRWRPGSAMRDGLKPEMLVDMVAVYARSFQCLVASGKTLGRTFVNYRSVLWLEEQPRLILRHWSEPGWDKAWEAWLDSMSAAKDLSCLSARQRRAAGRVARTRSVWSVRWNCLIASWLRRKGFLRRV